MNQLVTTGKVHRAALGILVEDASPTDAEYVGLDEIRGVLVRGFPDSVASPAEKAGLEQGDVIVAIDGKPVNYVAQLQQVVGFRQPGEMVKVEVARKGGVRKTFNVRLMEQREETPIAEREDSEQPESNRNAVAMGTSHDRRKCGGNLKQPGGSLRGLRWWAPPATGPRI